MCILRLRPAHAQQLAIASPQLDHDGIAEPGPLAAVEQHDPAILGRSLALARVRNMHDFIAFEATSLCQRLRSLPCLDREDPSWRTRGILHSAHRNEEDRAEQKPRGVEPRKRASEHAAIIRGVTRDEIAEKLIAIVRQEKNVSEEQLAPSTPLADAGIDSLDSLTILFAIEEHFKISIPDDRARAIHTFGDMIDVVHDLQKE